MTESTTTALLHFFVVAACMAIFVGFVVWMVIAFASYSEKGVQDETQEVASGIGSVAPIGVCTDEIFKTLDSFSLLDNVQGYKKARSLVVYPSDFGEVKLFWFSYMFQPNFPVNPVLRRATVLVCPNSFNISNVRVSSSWLYRIKQHFWGDPNFDRRLDEVLPDSIHRCHLEISEQGTMLYFPRLVFSTGDIQKLIADFEDVLAKLQQISGPRQQRARI